jgi:hypothetical protein
MPSLLYPQHDQRHVVPLGLATGEAGCSVQTKQALPEIENEPNEWGKLTGEAVVYHALGREQDSNTALAELIAKHETGSAFQIAQVYAFRGETDKSFEWLERAYEQRDAGLTIIKTDPLLKNLRHHPRYAGLLKKMRLPT